MRFVFIIAAIAIAMLGIVATLAYRQDWLSRDEVSDLIDDVEAAVPAS